MHDLIEIPSSGLAGPQSPRLREVLEAQSCAEDWRRRRTQTSRLVVALSVPMAYFLYRGQGIASVSAHLIFVLWLMAGTASLTFAFATWRAERFLEAMVTRAGGRYPRLDQSDEERHEAP